MDELLLVAGLVLFFALIVAPALAIRAWRKSSDTQRELGVLRERLTALEQQRRDRQMRLRRNRCLNGQWSRNLFLCRSLCLHRHPRCRSLGGETGVV